MLGWETISRSVYRIHSTSILKVNFSFLQSRQHHDNGVKHKQMVELYHKKKREEKFGGMHSEREMAKQLAEIDKAARDALLEDRATNQGMFHQNVGRSIPTRPPPPPRFDGNSNSKSNDNDNIEEDL